MAGYIMTLDSLKSLENCIRTGTYSTNLRPPGGQWRTFHEGTFADYLSMKSGDNIYFFIKRKIYGIGIIQNVYNDCKFLNYLEADKPYPVTENDYLDREPLLDGASNANRCFCTFIPSPYFFTNGIDMDDALNSNPNKFRMLRAMWKVSFIKIDDEENGALLNIILKRNEAEIIEAKAIFGFADDLHRKINDLLKRDINLYNQYRLTSENIVSSCADKGLLKHEMAIEAALCELLIQDNHSPFGKWDYISHQVVASPFKAVDYMDKMDIFGYKFIPGYSPTISKYLVIEIKKDAADVGVIEQIMKYVDWIQAEYAFGDYSMVEAYIVAAEYPEVVIQKRNTECIRYFTKGYRPSISCCWLEVKLIKYRYDGVGRRLIFEEIP